MNIWFEGFIQFVHHLFKSIVSINMKIKSAIIHLSLFHSGWSYKLVLLKLWSIIVIICLNHSAIEHHFTSLLPRSVRRQKVLPVEVNKLPSIFENYYNYKWKFSYLKLHEGNNVMNCNVCFMQKCGYYLTLLCGTFYLHFC